MASEDALEDLPGDQSVESLVPTEQSDTESSVGDYDQHRPQHGRLFLSIHYRGPSLFCQLPCSLPVKTLQIICDFFIPVCCCEFALLCELSYTSLQIVFVVKH